MSMHPLWERAARRRAAHALPAVLVATASLAACSRIDPTHQAIHYSLDPRTIARLEEAYLYDSPEGCAAQIGGALEMLVGTPQAPQFLPLAKWEESEFDPNYQGGDVDEAAWDEIVRDNRRRFARQLELIEAGRFAEVPEPKYALDLWDEWLADLAELQENPDEQDAELADGTTATRKEAAIDRFVNWYPTLRESAEMYRLQCLHCHGPEGGGDGPTAQFLDPRPRDYRHGVFKWVSVTFEARPVRSDLLHILQNGVAGTAMPPFARFSRGELEGLVDYVRLLAVRGETESLLALRTAEDGRLTPEMVTESYEIVWDRWLEAEKNYTAFAGEVPREATPESIERGRELFVGELANCFSCHGVEGRGDGASAYEGERTAEGEPILKKDRWGNDSVPRNFTQAVLRGGSRPIDLYRRIRNGISGTQMPAASSALTDEQVWDLVHYVQHLMETNDVARQHEAKLARAAAAHEPGHATDGSAPADEGHSDGGH